MSQGSQLVARLAKEAERAALAEDRERKSRKRPPPPPPAPIEFIEDTHLPQEDLQILDTCSFYAYTLETSDAEIFDRFRNRKSLRVTYVGEHGRYMDRMRLMPEEEDPDAYPNENLGLELKFRGEFYRLRYSCEYNPYVELAHLRSQEGGLQPCSTCTPFIQLCVMHKNKGPFEMGWLFSQHTEQLARIGQTHPCACGLDVISRILIITNRLLDALIQG